MHLNVPTWIVQGNAIPDGPTAYVLTSFKGLVDKKISKSMKNSCLIWNPCSGEYYHANDNFCPLQAVWAVVGNLNMWANVSENERPHQLDWDFSKSSTWKPLFSKPLEENKVSSVQTMEVVFKPADQVQANSLAQRMERHLKDAFMKWRKTSKTKWNRYCTAILRRLLPRLEEMKYGKSRTQSRPADEGSTAAESVHSISSDTTNNFNEEHLLELKDVMTTYQMTGFPLQQAYINMESVTESVFATGVHTIDTPKVEFAIAAYARSFPAGVYSVWVYIAALHRRK
jgi:coiled-coil and C2 domain-containing protein 2A